MSNSTMFPICFGEGFDLIGFGSSRPEHQTKPNHFFYQTSHPEHQTQKDKPNPNLKPFSFVGFSVQGLKSGFGVPVVRFRGLGLRF